MREYAKQYSKSANGRYVTCSQRAKKGGKTFTLTFEQHSQIIIQPCFYCGLAGPSGIDRVDNAIGYEANNCVPCCVDCNRAKLKMSQDEFFKMVKAIYEKHALDMRDRTEEAHKT